MSITVCSKITTSIFFVKSTRPMVYQPIRVSMHKDCNSRKTEVFYLSSPSVPSSTTDSSFLISSLASCIWSSVVSKFFANFLSLSLCFFRVLTSLDRSFIFLARSRCALPFETRVSCANCSKNAKTLFRGLLGCGLSTSILNWSAEKNFLPVKIFCLA